MENNHINEPSETGAGEEQTHFKEMEVAVAGKFSRLDHVAVDRPELLTGGKPGQDF